MHKVIPLFWNSEQRRLRAFWRILLAIPLFVGIAALVSIVVIFTVPSIDSSFSMTITLLISLVVTILWLICTALFLDHRPFAAYGLHMSRRWWLDLGFGMVLGGILMTGIFLVEFALGWVTITATLQRIELDQPFLANLLTPLVIFGCVGIYEELLFRGYFLPNIAEGLNRPPLGAKGAIIVAWIVTAVLFSFAHAFNPNTTFISTINLTLAGLWLGLGYVLTNNLALPIGLHITWNFFQGSVFGFPVSGQDFSQTTFIAIEQAGPPLWTGGAFGPEAGIIGIVAMLVGCGGVMLWVWVMDKRVALCTSLAEFRR